MPTRQSVSSKSSSDIAAADLRCEYLQNPLGIDEPSPRLSWAVQSERRAQVQTAYRLLVASDPAELAANTGDLWDTRKVRSGQSLHVPYAGRRLRSAQRCWWKVRLWDADGKPGAWSEPAWWEMGLLREDDWQGKWIHASPAPPFEGTGVVPSSILRKAFTLTKPVKSARAYVCGIGYHELHINGARVGDHVLDPAFTRYDRRVLYVTHDVTSMLAPGDNALGVMLGNGWYNCNSKDIWNFHTASWRDRPKLLLQLNVTYADGSRESIASDTTWRGSTGPIVFDGIRNGEIYDARLEKPGWTAPGFNDSDWKAATIVPGPGGVLRAQQMPPIRITRTLVPVALSEPQPGIFVFDVGQNCSGWAQLTVSGPAGTTIKLKYVEKLNDDGTIDPKNDGCFVYDREFQTDTYVLKGQGTEVWEPRFVYHGFRWVQVTGFPGRPTLDSLRGRVVHTDFEKGGEFACSLDLLNRIQSAALWATVSNYHGYPTDCPHREKNGWTGDAHLSAEQALYNFRPMAAYTKWLADFTDAQRPNGAFPAIVPTSGWGYSCGPAWEGAYVMIPWYLYLYCGDERILAEHYGGMKRYIASLTELADNGIVSFGLGDWCPPVGGAGDHKCPSAVTSTAYYQAYTALVSKIAGILGKAADERAYAALAEDIRTAFLAKFHDSATGVVADGGQTSQACALFHGLVRADDREKVLARLLAEVDRCDGHIDCGILGAKYVMQALSDAGRVDAAFRIASQTTFPSWGHWIEQGATTLWEQWNGSSSRNHHMFSDVSAWFYKALAGINVDPAAPGFAHVVIRPVPVKGLQWARGEHRSMRGLIASSWRKENGKFTLDVTIPANTTATVFVPSSNPKTVKVDGKQARRVAGVTAVRVEEGMAVVEVGSGGYEFEGEWEE